MEDARRLAVTRRRAFVTAQWKNRVKEPSTKIRVTPLGDISCVISDLVLRKRGRTVSEIRAESTELLDKSRFLLQLLQRTSSATGRSKCSWQTTPDRTSAGISSRCQRAREAAPAASFDGMQAQDYRVLMERACQTPSLLWCCPVAATMHGAAALPMGDQASRTQTTCALDQEQTMVKYRDQGAGRRSRQIAVRRRSSDAWDIAAFSSLASAAPAGSPQL